MVLFAATDGQACEDGEGDGEQSPLANALLQHIGEARLDIGPMLGKVRDAVLQSTQNKQQPAVYGAEPAAGLFFKVVEK